MFTLWGEKADVTGGSSGWQAVGRTGKWESKVSGGASSAHAG